MNDGKNYRFLGYEDNESQEAGFFVDSDDTVLYWPSRKCPGFRLSVEDALRIAWPELKKLESAEHLFNESPKNKTSEIRFFLCSIFIAIFFVILFPLINSIIEHLSLFSKYSSSIFVFFILSFSFLILMVIRGNREQQKFIRKTEEELGKLKFQRIPTFRPKPTIVRPENYGFDSKTPMAGFMLNWAFIAFGLTVPPIFFCHKLMDQISRNSENTLLPFDFAAISIGLMGIFMMTVFHLLRTLRGTNVSEINVLDPTIRSAALHHIWLELKESQGHHDA